MFQRYAAAAGFALVLAAGPFAATAPTPAPAGGMMVMDCSTAKAHISAMMTPTSDAMAGVSTADDVDKAYAAAMKAMVAQAQMMSKIEMKCGKNSKVMAVAKKMDDQLDSDALVVHALQTGF
jgi:hypothetical protein